MFYRRPNTCYICRTVRRDSDRRQNHCSKDHRAIRKLESRLQNIWWKHGLTGEYDPPYHLQHRHIEIWVAAGSTNTVRSSWHNAHLMQSCLLASQSGFASFCYIQFWLECIYVCSMLVVDICMSWPLWQCIQYVYRLHKCCIANMLPLRWCHLAVLINAGMFATWYHTWFTLLCEGVLKLLIACLCSARLCKIAS